MGSAEVPYVITFRVRYDADPFSCLWPLEVTLDPDEDCRNWDVIECAKSITIGLENAGLFVSDVVTIERRPPAR